MGHAHPRVVEAVADQAERLDAVKASLAEQMEDEVKDAFEALLEAAASSPVN